MKGIDMNKKYRANILSILLVGSILLPLIPFSTQLEISPVPDGTSSGSFVFSSSNKAVMMNDTQYVFYVQSDRDIAYIYKTMDNQTWSAAHLLTGLENPAAETLAAVSDGSRILLVTADGSGLGSADPRFLTLTAGADERLTVDQNTNLQSIWGGTIEGSMNVGYNSSGFPYVIGGMATGNTVKIFAANDAAGTAFTEQVSAAIGTTIDGTTICSIGNGKLVYTYGLSTGTVTAAVWDQTAQTSTTNTLTSTLGSVGARQVVCDPTNSKAHSYYKDSSNVGRYSNISDTATVGAETVTMSSADSVALSMDNSSGTVYYLTSMGQAVYVNVSNSDGTLIDSGIHNIAESSTIYDLNSVDVLYNDRQLFTAFRIGGSGMGYSLYSTVTLPVTLKFRDSVGQQVTPQNITLRKEFDNTQTTFAISGPDVSINLASGYYRPLSLYRNNVNLLDNNTEFFVSPAYNSHSIIVHNATLTFTFKDEITLNPYTAAKNLTLYFGNTSEISYNLGSNTTFTQGVPEIPNIFSVSFGDTGQFYRWNLVEPANYNQSFNVYLPNYTSYQVNNYVFDIASGDALNQFSAGSLKITKPTPDGLVVISHAENNLGTVTVPLIENHRYRLQALTEGETRTVEIGNFIPSGTLNVPLVVTEISFSTNLELSQKFIRWAVQRQTDTSACPSHFCAINVQYLDLTDTTTSLTINILNSSGLQYTTNTASSNFSLIWTGASSNISQVYWAQVISTSTRFGTLTDTSPASTANLLAGMPRVNLGFSSASCDPSLNPSPADRCIWYSYISIGVIIFVLGLFGAMSSTIAPTIGALTAAMVYYFGWLPQASPILIGAALLLSLLYAFGNRRIVQ